jgi:transcriptional regulator with XRE-family HTH domain
VSALAPDDDDYRRPPPPPPTTEGQRLLRRVRGSLAQLAKQVGAKSPQSVNDWKRGDKTPNVDARKRIEAAWGIPATAWSTQVSTPAAVAAVSEAPPPAPPANDNKSITPLQNCMQLLDAYREARAQPNLVPAERVRLADAEGRMLALRMKLEREAELSEDRFVRKHPGWKRTRGLIVKALAKHPAALAELKAVLGDWLGEEDTTP